MMTEKKKKRARPYAKLRAAMTERDLTQIDIARHLRRSMDYVNQRFRGEESFRLDEAYALLIWLGLSVREVYEYFPPDGYAEDAPALKVMRA